MLVALGASAGDRDPDSDNASGMSATKMRSAAVESNFEAFRQGLPKTLNDKDAQALMLAVQTGLTPVKKVKKIAPVETMLPAKAFAGTPKNKLGPAAHLKGSMKRPARAGDLVGGDSIKTDDKPLEDQRLDPKCWKGYKKSGTKMKGKTRVNNCVKIGEEYEIRIANLIKLLEKK